MDNIQKLILGVLSIAGMLAMLVPSGATIAPPPATEAPPAAAEMVAPAAAAEVVAEEENPDDSEITDEDVFVLGEPAIDGNPMQGQSNNNLDAPPAASAQFAPDYSQPAVVTGQSFSQPLAPPPAN